jgi:MEMO1 family protein
MIKDVNIRPEIGHPDFYPADENLLSKLVKDSIKKYKYEKVGKPFAIIAPAGNYRYTSKALAASYTQVVKEKYDTIVMISPIHRSAFQGIALTEYDHFSCPLGELEVDKTANGILHGFNKESITYSDKVHSKEHSIEVQLPYIYEVFGKKVKILPVIMGESNTKFTIMLAKALNEMMKKTKKKYLFVIPTDLCNGYKYDKAVATDREFADVIYKLKADHLAEQLAMKQIVAFGGGGLIALFRLAEILKISKIRVLELYNSGDINGEKLKVDGFVSAVMW